VAQVKKEAAGLGRLKSAVTALYTGSGISASRFRFGLLAFDVFTIALFLVSTMAEPSPWILGVETAIGIVLLADFCARLWIAPNWSRFLTDITTISDIVVIATLLAASLLENWAFLRVLRTLRLLRSYHVIHDLRSRYPFFARNEGVIVSTTNLIVFIFIVTAFVYVLEKGIQPEIQSYVDALYFTVTTLTTTGFGDITLTGTAGHLLSVVIMVVGVALFLRLAQTIFRPQKIHYICPDCGLSRHDPDASHCKHCGRTIYIETEGT
jgi:voltage-gated potassium channel